MNNDELISALLELNTGFEKEEKANCAAVKISDSNLFEALKKLKNHDALSFDMLLSHTAVHWINENQYELLYRLYSTKNKHHLLVCSRISSENPKAPSASSIWAVAEWQEREVYDLFGIIYTSHPDLRRIFLDDEWEGFPLRKDYKDDFMLENK